MLPNYKNANFIKRFAAWILDNLLIILLALGCCVSMTKIVGYEQNNQALDAISARYEAQYGVSFDMTPEEYLAMSEAEQANYDAASEALAKDPEALQGYGRMMGLTLIIASTSVLLPLFVMEFLMPICFGNGQTIGKKLFSLSLVRKDGSNISGKHLFLRTILGKYVIETMIPVLILLLAFWGAVSIGMLGILLVLVSVQFIGVAMTKRRTAIHDLIAGTCVVDMKIPVTVKK